MMRKLHPNVIKYRKGRLRWLNEFLHTGATETEILAVIRLTERFNWGEFDNLVHTLVSQTFDEENQRWMSNGEIARVDFDFIFPNEAFIRMYVNGLMNYAEYIAKRKIDISTMANETVKAAAHSLYYQAMRVDSPTIRARMMAGVKSYGNAAYQEQRPVKVTPEARRTAQAATNRADEDEYPF